MGLLTFLPEAQTEGIRSSTNSAVQCLQGHFEFRAKMGWANCQKSSTTMGRTRSAAESVVLVAALVVVGVSVEGAQTKGRSSSISIHHNFLHRYEMSWSEKLWAQFLVQHVPLVHDQRLGSWKISTSRAFSGLKFEEHSQHLGRNHQKSEKTFYLWNLFPLTLHAGCAVLIFPHKQVC